MSLIQAEKNQLQSTEKKIPPGSNSKALWGCDGDSTASTAKGELTKTGRTVTGTALSPQSY